MVYTLPNQQIQGELMTNDRRIVALLLVGLLAIFITISTKWFFNNFEKKEVEKNTGYSTEARRNKFLAAEYYLRDLGYEVESDSNRARLLETHENYQTILINDYGPKLSPTHFKKLKQWIENGGHLIFTASDFQYSYDEGDEYTGNDFKNNQLLEEYGILPSYTNFDEYKEDSDFDNEEQAISTYMLRDSTEISIDFSSSTQLLDTTDSASLSLNDRYGTHLVQLDIGEGKLTVLSDNYMLSNDYIGEHDHAYLLSSLNEINKSSSKKALLLYNNQSDSIFTLIWKHGKEACIAFLALLILSLWSLHNRFGPIMPIIDYSNRNITEHLRAIARFSWRQDHGIHLLNQSRIAREISLLKRYPTLKQMSTQERMQHISDILDIEPAKVHSALYFEPKSTNEYINSSHYLQKLWILQ